MDFDNLKSTISNLTLYDVKAAVRKAQNVVMNFTEMEAKVREATNNEPWGASSTLMNEIASGTYNYAQLNEIMNMIYKRFTEKAADEWRQIYKALQLLEFLVKNGSERVIDDARQHVSTIKMLRQFHFIDMNGKDQGLNVRNRAKELAELLSDVERIRAERKKTRANKNKYTGVEGGAGFGGGFSGGSGGFSSGYPGASASSRFGGFGSEDAEYGGYSGGVYGDGGGFSGGRSSTYQDSSRTSSRNNKFEEYDEYDEADATPSSRRAHHHNASTSSTTRKTAVANAAAKAETKPAAAAAPVEDLFSFGDDLPASSSAAPSVGIAPPAGKGKAAATAPADDFGDDDFDDFQSAAAEPAAAAPAPSTTSSIPALQALSSPPGGVVAPKPVSATQTAGLNDLVGFTTASPSPSLASQTPKLSSATTLSPTSTSSFQPMQPNYFTSVPASGGAGGSGGMLSPTMGSTMTGTTTQSLSRANTGGSATSSSAKKTSSGGDAFGSLWSTAAGIKKPSTPQGPQVSLAAMQKEKASQGIWGAGGSNTPSGSIAQGGSGFGGNSATNKPNSSSNGLDDLLM